MAVLPPSLQSMGKAQQLGQAQQQLAAEQQQHGSDRARATCSTARPVTFSSAKIA
jgi:hypothetical protein